MNKKRRNPKRYLILGAIVGALFGLSVSISMDFLYSDVLQGTWREAIASDLNNLLSLSVQPGNLIVIAVYIVILLVLALFGACMGVLFAFILYRFFTFLETD